MLLIGYSVLLFLIFSWGSVRCYCYCCDQWLLLLGAGYKYSYLLTVSTRYRTANETQDQQLPWPVTHLHCRKCLLYLRQAKLAGGLMSICLICLFHSSVTELSFHRTVVTEQSRPPSATVVSAEPFSHGTVTLQCLQKEIATYRHWSVSLWRDPDDVSHCRILSPDKTEWRLISTTLCGWRRCFVSDQLWFMTRIREEEEESRPQPCWLQDVGHRPAASLSVAGAQMQQPNGGIKIVIIRECVNLERTTKFRLSCSSVTKFVNTIFWKRMNRFWCKLERVHNSMKRSTVGSQWLRSHEARDRFGDVAGGIIPDPFGQVAFLVFLFNF